VTDHKNQKFAIEAAAQAIEEWWASDESSALLLASKGEFFLKCADIALQAAYEANILGRVIEAKTKDGKPITIRFWNRGESSQYQTEEWNLFVPFDEQLAQKSGDADSGAVRFAADLAALAAKGVDVTTMSPRRRRAANFS
jgi:hypothetical protein